MGLVPLVGSSAVEAQQLASPATSAEFAKARDAYDWTDRRDFEAADRGLVARHPEPEIRGEKGNVVWRFRDAEALRNTPPPATVHPLLWRQQQLNATHGLFKVTDRVFQIRGFDLANMTIIEGDSGLIIVDPLGSTEVSRAGLELYYQHRPKKPVQTVIYTHNHMDHFGGVRGVVSPEAVRAGQVKIIAPGDFLTEAVSENVSAGNAMLRRTIYYSGIMLQPGETGSMGAGLGPGVANGTQSFIAPTEEVRGALERRRIDGVDFVFLSANGTEAPSEFVFFLPQFGLLDVSEVAVRTIHNVLTPRGAKARDAALWWKAIDAMIENFGSETKVVIGQHHWPSWGHDDALAHLSAQRDFYKAVYDRSLHMANKGVTMGEIGENLELPVGLRSAWSVQDYYGTLGSAGKATYQYYLGWYDGNPASLDALPKEESAARYVAYMGGATAIMDRARADFAKGDYRWVAEILDRLIFAEPDNKEARELQAQTLTQLGYQQTSATWRNVYLTAARELRQGVVPIPFAARSRDFLVNMSSAMLLDYAGIALAPAKAQGKAVHLNFEFGTAHEAYEVTVVDGILTYRKGRARKPDATLKLDNQAFDMLISQRASLSQAKSEHQVVIEGDEAKAQEFFEMFDTFAPNFNIVTP